MIAPKVKKENKLKLLRKHQRSSRELIILTKRIKSFRANFKFEDEKTNPGIIYSPTLYSPKIKDTSVKIIITSPLAREQINFTCNASTSVEHLIGHAVCCMFDDVRQDDNMENYMLKVTGKDEYIDSKLCLADYGLVSDCCKFDSDVRLTLITKKDIKRTFLRISQDDYRCKKLLCPDDLMPSHTILKFSDLNYESLDIIIQTFDREAERLYHDVTNRSCHIQTQSLIQTTKAICSLMMNCETSQLTESKDNLIELCRSYRNEGGQLLSSDRYMMIEVIQHAIKKLMVDMHRLLRIFSQHLPVDYEVVDIDPSPYVNTNTSQMVDEDDQSASSTSRSCLPDSPIDLIRDQVTIRIQSVSQMRPDWTSKYEEYHLRLALMHGETVLCPSVATNNQRCEQSLFNRLSFEQELVLSLSYCDLPRESRFVLTLFGTQYCQSELNLSYPNDSDNQSLKRAVSSSSITSTTPVVYSSSPESFSSQQLYHTNNNQFRTSNSEPVQTAIAQTICYLFDFENNLRQGDGLLCLHSIIDENETTKNRESIYIECIPDRQHPILIVEFRRFEPEKHIYFPNDIQTLDEYLEESRASQSEKLAYKPKAFEDLDTNTQCDLRSIIHERQFNEKLLDDEKQLIWDNRYHLTEIPEALPKVLTSAPNWSLAYLPRIYHLLEIWSSPDPIDGLELLLPSTPDSWVRKKAIQWISQQNDDELCHYLPQLLQTFRYEKNLDCTLLWLILGRSMKNARIANLTYWQLKMNTLDKILEERSEILINCLLWLSGSAFWKSVDKQEKMLSILSEVSIAIKNIRDSQRQQVLINKLDRLQDFLVENKPSMPWAPSLEVCALELNSCSYFQSNSLPMKLSFRCCEISCNKSIKFHNFEAIFKAGDDLRQDMLMIHMIRIMEKLWLQEGLDLQMVTFDCIATSERQGMVELVQNAETLRKIHQNSSFLTGSFNPKAIDAYIRLWNTSELEYKTAVDKFLHSCAGYSVATYILGICDRHNDNILVTTSGHLFHIDYGKFLGDAQMLGSIKRDRTPFVLTSDMAYVINGGDRPSKKFQTFIELCTLAFNIIRRHKNIFINLFSLMSNSKIHGLNSDSVNYINRMLMPELSEIEAMAKFTRLIEDCLNSRSAQVNFFIHNLAQLKFSNDNSRQSLLSFVPKTFTMQVDGRIEALKITNLFKRYEPEKQYYYVIWIKRQNQPDPTEVFRTFREFSELQMKLACMFPCSKFHDIQRSSGGNSFMDFVVRTNTREIAHKRLIELRLFVNKLLTLPDQISHCDLIYTFFHPILRDQQSIHPQAQIAHDSSSFNDSFSSSGSTFFGQQPEYTESQRRALYMGSNGQVKCSISYKNSTLIIMIMHAKNLASPEGVSGPNSYAKTYLLPDPHKQTKKRTRVIRQSCHPTFMELIVYNQPNLDHLRRLTLQISIWHNELVSNKAFLGAAMIPLNKLQPNQEITSWYALKNLK